MAKPSLPGMPGGSGGAQSPPVSVRYRFGICLGSVGIAKYPIRNLPWVIMDPLANPLKEHVMDAGGVTSLISACIVVEDANMLQTVLKDFKAMTLDQDG